MPDGAVLGGCQAFACIGLRIQGSSKPWSASQHLQAFVRVRNVYSGIHFVFAESRMSMHDRIACPVVTPHQTLKLTVQITIRKTQDPKSQRS